MAKKEVKSHTKVQTLEQARRKLDDLLFKQRMAVSQASKDSYNEFIHRQRELVKTLEGK